MRLGPGATSDWFATADEAETFQAAILGNATLGVGPSAEVTICGVTCADATKCDIWGMARPS
jgi:hypothetical protein